MADLSLVTEDTLSLEKSYVQLTLVASEAIDAGEVLCIDPTTGKWALADSDDVDQLLYMAMKSVASGESVTGVHQGVVDGFDLSELDYGAPVYLSDTAGAISSDDTDTIQVGNVIPGQYPTLNTAYDKVLYFAPIAASVSGT